MHKEKNRVTCEFKKMLFRGDLKRNLEVMMLPVHPTEKTDEFELEKRLLDKSKVEAELIQIKEQVTNLSEQNTELINFNGTMQREVNELKIDIECSKERYEIMRKEFRNDVKEIKVELVSVTKEYNKYKENCRENHQNELNQVHEQAKQYAKKCGKY